MKSKPQPEFAGVAQVFNLACECGEDPARVVRERLESAERAAAAREYALKMQRLFSECPGFLGADPPEGETRKGRVVVEPAFAQEARTWLRRRFHVNDAVEICETGLCLEVVPPERKSRGQTRKRVSFAKPEQLKLTLI